MIEFITNGPPDSVSHVMLAHGAGTSMRHAFLERLATALAENGLRSTRFNFAYMAEQEQSGRRRPPPPIERLVGEYRLAIDTVIGTNLYPSNLLIGGKSMGGRVASMTADDYHAQGKIAGLVCLGYPFHPAGKSDRLRIQHLKTIASPTLIVQGDNDPFGSRRDVSTYELPPEIQMSWIAGGDHDLKTRMDPNPIQSAARAIAAFANGLRPR